MLVQVLNHRDHEVGVNEEFEVGLLVDIAFAWAPSKYGITRWNSITGWL